jgi:hypothetical protein
MPLAWTPPAYLKSDGTGEAIRPGHASASLAAERVLCMCDCLAQAGALLGAVRDPRRQEVCRDNTGRNALSAPQDL